MNDPIMISKKYVLELIKMRREYGFENAMKVAKNIFEHDHEFQTSFVMIFGVLGDMFTVIVNTCEEFDIPDNTIADIIVSCCATVAVMAGLDKDDVDGGKLIIDAIGNKKSIVSLYLK